MRFPVVVFATAMLFSGVHAFSGKRCRIMPLGASITYGVGSSQGNGYRDDLYNLLAAGNNTVNMVGESPALRSTFHDKDTEGWPGYRIEQVAAKMRISMPLNRPNIVTLLVGTNDMAQGFNVTDAPKRLGQLIDDILNFPPLTLVVVSSLPANKNTNTNARIIAYNAAIPGVVRERFNAGRPVVFADCGALVGVADLPDGTHPNDAGYERIARCFFDGIVRADARGWIYPTLGPAP